MHRATDLVCISHLRWGFVFQRPNHLMSRCAMERRTFFWEEPVFDLGPSKEAQLEMQTVSGIRLAVPHLPRGLDERSCRQRQKALFDQMLAENAIEKPILWLYTPMALDFVDHVPASAVVYDCMDELSAFRGAPPSLQAREQELFRRAHVVFTGGESLHESKSLHHPRVMSFPSSVDSVHFARARNTNLPEPADQRAVPRPRLGYFGVIDERIDLALLASVADAQPSWHVVMVGPIAKIDPASLPRRPNIHYLGPKSYDALPSYIAGWHVALMPFALNEATRFISPTKTLEYLAAGVPVVSTPIRDVVRPYGQRSLVRIGDRESFAHQISEAIAEPPELRRTLADAWVAQTSWDDTWRRMSSVLQELTRERPGEAAHVASTLEEGSLSCSTISS